MPTTVRDLVRVLEERGWERVAQRGSHRQFKHPEQAGRVTVAGHGNREIPPGTLRNILRQAGLTREDLP